MKFKQCYDMLKQTEANVNEISFILSIGLWRNQYAECFKVQKRNNIENLTMKSNGNENYSKDPQFLRNFYELKRLSPMLKVFDEITCLAPV